MCVAINILLWNQVNLVDPFAAASLLLRLLRPAPPLPLRRLPLANLRGPLGEGQVGGGRGGSEPAMRPRRVDELQECNSPTY